MSDLDAAASWCVSHLRVVVAIARGYMGYGLPHADLIQEGNIGLMKAVKRFDPERGVRLVSFAVHWITRRDARVHPAQLAHRQDRDHQGAAQAVLQPAQHEAGPRHAERDEVKRVAEQLDVKPEEVVEMETRLGGQDIALEPPSDDDEDSLRAGRLPRRRRRGAGPRARARGNRARCRARAWQALASSDARSRRIIEARWLREKDQATLHELADEFERLRRAHPPDRRQGDDRK